MGPSRPGTSSWARLCKEALCTMPALRIHRGLQSPALSISQSSWAQLCTDNSENDNDDDDKTIPKKLRATDYPGGGTASWNCASRTGRCCPKHESIVGLTFRSFLKQTFHWSPWERHVERLQDSVLKVRQLLNLVAFFFFCSSTNTDRQTDKPKSRFQESTEAQDKLLWCYIDFLPPNVSHEMENFTNIIWKSRGPWLCQPWIVP